MQIVFVAMMVFREYDLLVYLLNKQALLVAEGDSHKLEGFSFFSYLTLL